MKLLYLEPFNGGSHRQFTESLFARTKADWTALTLPGRHWKWRARGSAVFFAREHGDIITQPYQGLWASSFLPLQDLIALAPQLAMVPRVLYFHENQLAYPNRPEWTGERDHHFGISQMISALVATHCVFNSQWNLDSFLDAGTQLLKRMPDAVPPGWIATIRERSSVLPVPLDLPDEHQWSDSADERSCGPIILWNHRWEHDKNPEGFFHAMMKLHEADIPFRLAVCGERYRRYPEIFDRAREVLNQRIIHWGMLPSRNEYEALMQRSHIVVSTAFHEFFGVSMVEATHFGVCPVVPNRLAYPEIFPQQFRYDEVGELVTRLTDLCCDWVNDTIDLRSPRFEITRPFGRHLWTQYQAFIESTFLDV